MPSHKKALLIPLVAALLCLQTAMPTDVLAAGSQKNQTMREKVYEKLSKAQEDVENDKWEDAFDRLDKVKKMRDLTDHEKAQLYTAYGYTYFAHEEYAKSAEAYETVLVQEDLAEAMRTSTLYTLGQLYFHLEKFDKAVGHLETWLQLAENPGPQPYILLGQGYYHLGLLDKAAPQVRKAISVAEKRNAKVQENWYALLRVIYFETKEYDDLLEVLEILVTRYPAKEYWLHLASAYGEMDNTQKQLATYDAAYALGYLTSSSEIVLLCQLLLQAEVPYRAGVLLQENLENGVVKNTAGNWRLLSQAWILAQEHDAAIYSLGKAAEMSDDGELYARIAQSYAHLNKWELSAEAAATALAKGVKNPQELQLMQGMAYFELRQFTQAKAAFREAQKSGTNTETASRWLAYVQREEKRLKELGIN